MDIDNRKDILLLLLYSPGRGNEPNEPISGRTKLIKLMYLFTKEVAPKFSKLKSLLEKQGYDFKPYHYGPFSKEIYDDIQFLENINMIEEKSMKEEPSMAEMSEIRFFYSEALVEGMENLETTEDYSIPSFSLSQKGLEFTKDLFEKLSKTQREKIKEFKRKYNNLPLSTLLRYVYTTYPNSAIKSQIHYLK